MRQSSATGGRLRFDASKPDGMPLKALDSSRLRRLGWRPAADFRTALAETYAWFLQAHAAREADREPANPEDPIDVRAAV